jgi:hypothetical protein
LFENYHYKLHTFLLLLIKQLSKWDMNWPQDNYLINHSIIWNTCTSLLHIIMFYDKKVNSPIFTNAKYIYRQWPKVFVCLRISLCISYKTMVFQIIILRSIHVPFWSQFMSYFDNFWTNTNRIERNYTV